MTNLPQYMAGPQYVADSINAQPGPGHSSTIIFNSILRDFAKGQVVVASGMALASAARTEQRTEMGTAEQR